MQQSIRRVSFSVLVLLFASAAPAQASNPIVVENANRGSAQWRLTKPADDSQRQIKGFAATTSVNKGRRIDLKISVDTPQTYRIDLYRMGWYGGTGGRLLFSVDSLAGTTQSAARYDSATGMVSHAWDTSYSLAIRNDWTSGFYLAKLTNEQGFQNYISFVVRDDARQADLLYQQPVTTYQAYNSYPRSPQPTSPTGPAGPTVPADPCLAMPEQASDAPPALNAETPSPVPFNPVDIGKSLYEFNSSDVLTEAGTSRALQVSFDRPYEGDGDGQFFSWEFYTVRWLEREGYDVSYATNIDVHKRGKKLLQRYEGFISAGHDEYYSRRMFNAVEGARDAGTDLAYLGSNAIYWQVRFAANAAGARHRIMVSYKDAALDPVNRASRKSVRWREVGRAEQALLGVQYVADNQAECNTPYVVTNSDSFVYEGTGFEDGDTVAGITGYEVDRFFPEFSGPITSNQTLLSDSAFRSRDGLQTQANASIYQAPSDAWVFASGTMSWAWALDRAGFVDSRIQIATRNILARFLGTGSNDPDTDPKSDPAPMPDNGRVLLDADFEQGKNGFFYSDDAFLATTNAAYADGYRSASGDATPGSLGVVLGDLTNGEVLGLSGGWNVDVNLATAQPVRLRFRYRLTLDPPFEADEYGEVRASLDGVALRENGRDFISRVTGGSERSDTGWATFETDLGTLNGGWHRLTIGVYNNKRDAWDEWLNLLVDDVRLTSIN